MKKILLPLLFCVSSLGVVFGATGEKSIQTNASSATSHTMQTMLKTIWNGGEQTEDYFSYNIGHGTLSTSSAPGWHDVTKNMASEGNFDGNSTLVDWGGERVNGYDDDRLLFKVKALKPTNISISVSADPEGWNDNQVEVNYYKIDGDIVNGKWYDKNVVKKINFGSVVASDFEYSISIATGETFIFEYGGQWAANRNWENFGDTVTLEFERGIENKTFAMSNIIVDTIKNGGSDVEKGLVNYNVKHGNYTENIVSNFDNYSSSGNTMTTTTGDAFVTNWRITSRKNDGVIFLFDVLKYSTFTVSREMLGSEWYEGSYINIYINHVKVKETYFESENPALSCFDFSSTVKIGDEIAWEFIFAGENDSRIIAMKDGGDIITSMPKFNFTEILHTHSWGELGNGKAPTCGVDGWKDYSTCECGLYAEDSSGESIIGSRKDLDVWKQNDGKIAAKGHNFGDITYEWSSDNSICTASHKCSVCQEVVSEFSEAEVTHTKEPTCIETGLYHYKAVFVNTDFETQEKDVIIPNSSHSIEFVSSIPATCASDGIKSYYVCKICNKYYEDELGEREIVDLDNWKKTDGKIPALEHDLLLINGNPATCSFAGYKDYFKCLECNKYFEDSEGKNEILDITSWKNADGKINPLGHVFGEVSYLWSEDNSSCTASRKCTNVGCLEIETEAVDVIKKDGLFVATFTNPAFKEQTKPIPSNAGLIIGVSIGSAAVVGVAAGAFFIIRKKRRILLDKISK